MDERYWARRIKRIEAEILAQKQAHMVGLGLANFYSVTETHTFSATTTGWYVFVKVKFSSEVTEMPFVQCFIDEPEYYTQEDIEWDGSTNTATIVYYYALGSSSVDFIAKIISSSIVESVTITDRSWWS